MDLGQGVYALATRAFRVNYPAFVAIAMAQAALQAVPPLLSPGAVVVAGVLGSLLQIPLLFLALVTLLTGGSALSDGVPGERFWRFALRFVLMGLPPTLVLFAAGDPVVATLLMMAVSIVAMGLFGTVLPDAAIGNPGRFGDALVRGRRSFGAFVAWMLQGPALTLFGLGVAVGVFSTMAVMTGAGMRVGPDDRPVLAPWFVGLVSIAGSLGGAYVTALTAAVLAKCWDLGGGRAP